ncbi:TROVE domain-containing protein, partial [Candidatus Aerophobetes bacterium]
MKFNKPTKGQAKTINYEGATSYKTDAKTELISRVLCSLVGEKKFYISGEKSNEELVALLKEVANQDPEFCLKLAAYARNEMYLRSVPQLILVEMANHPKVKKTGYVVKYAPYIIKRADEITEVIAYQLTKFNKPIPNSLKKAIAESFNRFDAYQLAKYNRGGAVELRDAMFLCHPKPKDKIHEEIFRKLADQTLEPPETWEVVISTKGSTKENWEAIIPKMGVMATLRNLRNFLLKDVNLEPVIARLTNPEKVKNSKQLPFRFLAAYREVEKIATPKTQLVLEAIAKAMELSIVNLPKLEGYTCIAVDNSGSMNSPLSERSSMEYRDIAATMGAALNKISNSIVVVFSDDAHFLTLNRSNDILSNVDRILSSCNPSSTNAYRVPVLLEEKRIKVD